MIPPREEYKFMKDINNIRDIAYFTIFEKYLVQNLKGDKKLIEIESTDQESIIVTRNGGYPIPGMVYTFIYGEPDQILLKFGQKNFIDLAPVVFCINNQRGSFSGINMNMLPENARLQFFESFYQTFKDFLEEKVDELAQNKKLALNKRFIEFIKSGGGQEMIKLFSKKNKANFNYGYRSYKIEKVKRLRMIEYCEWIYIPFYNPKNAFRKMNQAQIYKLYNRNYETKIS